MRSRFFAKAPLARLSSAATSSSIEVSQVTVAATQNDLCSICLCPLQDSVSYLDGCKHQYCLQCISFWAKVKLNCPYCKAAFTTITCPSKSIIQVCQVPETAQEEFDDDDDDDDDASTS